MKSKNKFFYLFLLILIACSACKDGYGGHLLNASIQRWLLPFDAEGRKFTYQNELNEEATVTVSGRIFPDESTFIDCSRPSGPGQCQYEVVTLEFDSDRDTLMYLSVWLFGEDRLTMNYSHQVVGLTPEIAIYTSRC